MTVFPLPILLLLLLRVALPTPSSPTGGEAAGRRSRMGVLRLKTSTAAREGAKGEERLAEEALSFFQVCSTYRR
jgi:hypothetical protein